MPRCRSHMKLDNMKLLTKVSFSVFLKYFKILKSLKETMIIFITLEILGGVIKIKRFWFGRDDPTQKICNSARIKYCINNTMHTKQNENGKKWCDNDKNCTFKACKSFEALSRNNLQ